MHISAMYPYTCLPPPTLPPSIFFFAWSPKKEALKNVTHFFIARMADDTKVSTLFRGETMKSLKIPFFFFFSSFSFFSTFHSFSSIEYKRKTAVLQYADQTAPGSPKTRVAIAVGMA